MDEAGLGCLAAGWGGSAPKSVAETARSSARSVVKLRTVSARQLCDVRPRATCPSQSVIVLGVVCWQRVVGGSSLPGF